MTDAVLARLARLPPAARELAELVSMFPNQADGALLKTIAPDSADAIDRCLQQGLLVARGDCARVSP